MSFTLSDEQQNIIDEIKKGNNIFVNAVAGSGKTTTVTELAKQIPKKILQLTYNSLLKLEVRNKVNAISNIEVHSYHSFCVNYYDKHGYQDNVITDVIYKDKTPNKNINFDILVIDETQDMTLLLFKFVKKIIKDNIIKDIQVLLLGDVKQAIYEFKGSDSRFLSHCNKIWDRKFIELKLSTSYRLTHNIAKFVNEVMLGYNRINTVKDGPEVAYIVKNAFRPKIIYEMIVKYLENGYSYDDIFILAPSLKSSSNTPLKCLENMLCENKIPCFVPNGDENKLDEKVIKGKITFCSFHQSKGRERPIVIIYSFDNKWFNYFGKGRDTFNCPNELYVAVTRSSHKLILLQADDSVPLSFFRTPFSDFKYKPYIEYIINTFLTKRTDDTKKESDTCTCVTELTKFIKEDIIETLNSQVKSMFSCKSHKNGMIVTPSTIQTSSGLIEQVSDVNGTAIAAMWQFKNYNTISIKDSVNSIFSTDTHAYVKSAINSLPEQLVNPSDYLQWANVHQALMSGYISKLVQIEKYDWLDNDTVEDCMNVMNKFMFNGSYICEYSLEEVTIDKNSDEYINEFGRDIKIKGTIDAMNDKDVWELKCVDFITLEHFLQVVLYAWMWNKTMTEHHGPRKFFILNIRTEEMFELDTTSQYINEIVKQLLLNKYMPSGKISDIEFIKNCKEEVKIQKEKQTQQYITNWLGSKLA